MNISEYVAKLEAIKAEHGDLRVTTWETLAVVSVRNKREPTVKGIRQPNRHERKSYYGQSWKGSDIIEKVCHI